MTANEAVLKAQVDHLQKRLREEEEAWKESVKCLAGELHRQREEAGRLAGELAKLKAGGPPSCAGHGSSFFMPLGDGATSRPFSIWPEGEAPAGWARDGVLWEPEGFRLEGERLVVGSTLDKDGKGSEWLHVMLTRPDRLPSLDDVNLAKLAFIGPGEAAWLCVEPDSERIDVYNNCLHLFAPWPLSYDGAGRQELPEGADEA